MASRISLACHTIRVVDRGKKCFRKLGQVSADKDLETVFTEYLDLLQESYALNDEQQVARQIQRYGKKGGTVHGIITAGEYGFATNLMNVNTGDIAHTKDKDEADMMPFYFLAYLPSHQDEGILLLQRRGNRGIRPVFSGDFKSHVEKKCPGVTLEINSLVPRQLLNEYLENGRFSSLRLIQMGIPSGLVKAKDAKGHTEREGKLEVKYIPARGKGLDIGNKVKNFLDGSLSLSDFVEVSGSQYDKAIVEVDLYGSKKTIDLSDTDKMNTNIDITKEVRINEQGLPVFESIDGIAQGLLDRLLGYLGIDREYAG